ncbi:hypothetical protein Q5X54_08630 [Acinetobacter baumannii]|nr:hypothetical protein [Acinetobacter baumannii]MDV7490318.1 hypothetical protein [Acinetobacter baumannii]
MRLNAENLSTTEQLEEFDQWLTAKLDKIKDSVKFNSEITSLCNCISILSPYLNNFSEPSTCSIHSLVTAVKEASLKMVSGKNFNNDEKAISGFYDSFFNLLFLTSGATDNNLKNHFLIKLHEDGITPLIPKRVVVKKQIIFKLNKIPSTTKSDFMAHTLASCMVGTQYPQLVKTEPFFDLDIYLKIFLEEYIKLILEDEEDLLQFWAICHSYIQLSNNPNGINLGKYLLNSCTIFKVRGSVSASGGHITESLLREKLEKIGLRANIDYNNNDVKIGDDEVVEDGKRKKKTRAYDFVIPYQLENWAPKPKLFIQSQFYAGDSGSVSHKVVDQTQSSRTFTLTKYPNAKFVEYLDGAGYYASLRGDLEHMLSFSNTESFFQVKSILIRLRREFQKIDFLTGIEIQHAILVNKSSTNNDIKKHLINDGYSISEIERSIQTNLELGMIAENELNNLYIPEEKLPTARRILILDIAANNSYPVTSSERSSQKYILVPGYGVNIGIKESELSELACNICKNIVIGPTEFIEDIEWLLDEGVFQRF